LRFSKAKLKQSNNLHKISSAQDKEMIMIKSTVYRTS